MRRVSTVRRAATGVAAAAAMTLVLGACSSGGGGGAVDDNPDKGLPVQGETLTYDPNTLVNDGQPVTLDWWVWFYDEGFQGVADAYHEIHPNVTINVVNQPWNDYWTKLPLELQGNKGPALFNIHNSQEENILPYAEPYDIPVDDLVADYTGAGSHVKDGQVRYIDLGLMSGAIYYNTDMWEAAGLTDADIPEDWDSFREVAKKLTVRDGNTLRQAGFNFNSTGNAFQGGLAYQLGQNLFDEAGTEATIDNEANLEVIQRFLDIYEDGSGDPNFGTDSDQAFGQGLSAMTYNWGHYVGTLARDYPEINYGTFQTPVPVAGETPYAFDRYNGEATFGINANAPDEQKAAAQDFLRFFLTDEEFLTQICLDFGIYPAYKPIAADPAFAENPAIAAFGDIERYIWPGAMPAGIEVAWKQMWEDVLYNNVDPKVALATAQSSVDTDLAGSGFVSVENLYPFYKPTS